MTAKWGVFKDGERYRIRILHSDGRDIVSDQSYPTAQDAIKSFEDWNSEFNGGTIRYERQ